MDTLVSNLTEHVAHSRYMYPSGPLCSRSEAVNKKKIFIMSCSLQDGSRYFPRTLITRGFGGNVRFRKILLDVSVSKRQNLL